MRKWRSSILVKTYYLNYKKKEPRGFFFYYNFYNKSIRVVAGKADEVIYHEVFIATPASRGELLTFA